jgi:hypothetical protein
LPSKASAAVKVIGRDAENVDILPACQVGVQIEKFPVNRGTAGIANLAAKACKGYAVVIDAQRGCVI